jgi:hypothetical protein
MNDFPPRLDKISALMFAIAAFQIEFGRAPASV